MTSPKPIVSVEHVSFAYQAESVLEDISLSIFPGDFIGLIGPNGSGKTTLLKIIIGLLQPSKGNVELFGQPIKQFHDWKKIGYIPQKAQISFHHIPLTVSETVRMAGGNSQAIKKALDAVDMTGHTNDLFNRLSGGQQQRVLIARAIVNNPQLLILDEPTVGIDARSQTRFYKLLKRLNKTHQLTLVLISHDVSVIAHEVSKIACINKTLIYHGEPQGILNQKDLSNVFGSNFRIIAHDHH